MRRWQWQDKATNPWHGVDDAGGCGRGCLGALMVGVALGITMIVLATTYVFAEDGRCEQLRQLRAQGAATSGRFTRAQVAMATVWYRRNCGVKQRRVERD